MDPIAGARQLLSVARLTAAANWASIAGLAVSVIGLSIAIRQSLAARTAAEAARDAVERIRARISTLDIVVELSATGRVIDEIKRLTRNGHWLEIPDRCASVRASLVTIKAGSPNLTDEQSSILTGAIAQFTLLEDQVERHIAGRVQSMNAVRINQILSEQQDKLTESLVQNRFAQMR